VKRGIFTYQALSAEILPRFARQDTSLALSRQRLFSTIIYCSAIFVVTSPAFSQTFVTPQPLKIIWKESKSRKPANDKKALAKRQEKAKDACQSLGKALQVGRGPWGFGAFSTFVCYRDNKVVSGKARKTDWSLIILDTEKNASFTLMAGNKIVAEVKIQPSEFTFQILSDNEFIDLLAYSLLDSMPMGLNVTKASMKKTTTKFLGRYWRAGDASNFKYKMPPPPEEIILYHLRKNDKNGRFVSQVVATAKVNKLTKPKAKKDGKRDILVGGSVLYEADSSIAADIGKNSLWGQNAAGPGGRQAELKTIIDEAHLQLDAAAKDGSLDEFLHSQDGGITKFLLATTASGYVGLRYGLQVLPGDSIISKTNLFSLLLEIRGGPVKGLRYYYDKIPKTVSKKELSDGTEDESSIESARHVLAYSFGFDPGFLVDRVTIDPKLGMWSFNASLPSNLDDDGVPREIIDFTLGNTLSLALEIGTELQSDWYTLRGWYAIDTGFSVLKKGGTVTSNRFGIDAYFTAGPQFSLLGLPVKTALLAFYVYEAVTLKNGDNIPSEDGEEKISEVPYSTGYAGGGIALSW
jgi:hypothetical protein